MLGEIASAAKLAVAAAQGFKALQRLQPEYGRFWKKFESELKPEERDLPWDRLAMLRFDPEFVGAACRYIRGDRSGRQRIRKDVAALAEPPVGGRYDGDEIVERVMRAADEAAATAAKDDRDVVAQRGRLLEGRIDELEENLGRQLRELQDAMAEIRPPRPLSPERAIQGGDARPLHSKAESELGAILDRDPDVRSWVPESELRSGSRGYRPDFVIEDHDGVNWFVELKGNAWTNSAATREQVRMLAKLVDEAGATLGGQTVPTPGCSPVSDRRWRFALVTPIDLKNARSWRDVVTRSQAL